MSILVTDYAGVKKGKMGYRQNVEPLTVLDIPEELYELLIEEGYDTPDKAVEFLQGVRDLGFKLVRVG